MAMNHSRNLSLDGLRGIAILLVLLYHAIPTLGTKSRIGEGVLWFGHLGWVGVEVFFVLSGYLITGILLKTRNEPGFFGRFYLRRALRIWPLYCGMLVLLLVVPLVVPALRTADYGRFLSMQGWLWMHAANIARAYYGANAALQFGVLDLNHFWSLSVEEHFYLFWPLVVYYSRHLVPTVVVIALAAVVLQLMPIADPFWSAVAATPRHLFGLAVGCLTAIGLPKRPLLAASALLPVSLVWVALGGLDAYSKTLLSAASALATAAAIVVIEQDPDCRFARALRNPLLVTFGFYSYGIYVFHYLFEPVVWTLDFSTWPGGYLLGAMSFVSLYIALPYLAARVSYAVWESHWLKLKDKVGHRKFALRPVFSESR